MKAQSTGKKSGQSLVEILIAVTLMAMGISFATILIYGGQNVLIDRGNSVKARSLAEEGLDAARSIGARSWTNIASGTYGLSFSNNKWQFSGGADYNTIFTRKITVTDVASNEKQIDSEVTWSANAKLDSVKLTTLVTNWQNALAPPNPNDTGGSPPSGNWQNPKTLGSIDLGPGESATGLRVVNKIVFMAAQASSQAKPDFFVVDATNGQSPVIVSSLDTGPGLLSIDVSGNYAYVGNSDNDNQLQVINISNRNNPSLVTSFKLPGVSGSGAIGNTVFYGYSKVFVGTKQASGPEFFMIDVSNPAIPKVLGSKDIGADVNGIYVYGNTAYLATSDSNAELQVYDISNPVNISRIGSYNFASGSAGKSVYLSGTELFAGRLSGAPEFGIFDVSTPASPKLLGSQTTGGDLNAMRVNGSLAFLGTSNSNSEFQVFNISNPANPTLYSSFNFPQVATGVDYENNIVYVSVRSNDGLRIVTSQ